MKKILLSVSTLVLALTANAQMSANGDGFRSVFTDPASNCYANITNGNGGIMNGDGATFGTSTLKSTGLELPSISGEIAAGINPRYFSLPVIVPGTIGDGTDDQCSSLNAADQGVDLTNNPRASVRVKSDVVPATLEFFLGGEGQWFPTTSTFASEIIASGEISVANQETVLYFDFSSIDADKWAGFAGKNKIQSVGFRSATSGATFTVINVLLGSEAGTADNVSGVVAKSLNVYPNPASDVLTVEVDAVAASSVELVDLSGKLVATQSVGAGFNKVQFNVANVNAGLYFLSVRSANGVVTQKVIVK